LDSFLHDIANDNTVQTSTDKINFVFIV